MMFMRRAGVFFAHTGTPCSLVTLHLESKCDEEFCRDQERPTIRALLTSAKLLVGHAQHHTRRSRMAAVETTVETAPNSLWKAPNGSRRAPNNPGRAPNGPRRAPKGLRGVHRTLSCAHVCMKFQNRASHSEISQCKTIWPSAKASAKPVQKSSAKVTYPAGLCSEGASRQEMQ